MNNNGGLCKLNVVKFKVQKVFLNGYKHHK